MTQPARQVVILIADPFEDRELSASVAALESAGISYDIVSAEAGLITGMWGVTVEVVKTVGEVEPGEYDGLMIMGGDGLPELRAVAAVREFVVAYAKLDRPIGAICWGPTILAEAGVATGIRMTGCCVSESGAYAGMTSHDVLRNHGVELVFDPICQDKHYLTAPGPSHAKAFAERYVGMLMGE